MEEHLDCYWSNSRSCNIAINKFEGTAFIIASNDPSRIDILNKIKKTVKEFNLDPKFAIELEENNNLTAFCDSICAYIRGSRINIVDLTAPLRQRGDEDSIYEEPSVNVYWEYGYAAGLKKTIILICEEKQADSIPFNILDKQILYYQEDNIEEELGSLLKHKLEHPDAEFQREASKKKTAPLNIGKTTDLLKNMGKGEMINIIRQHSFQDLFELTKNIMETIIHIESPDECKEYEGLHSFINLLLKSNFTDQEFIKIFGVILKKFLENPDFQMKKIQEKLSASMQKVSVKEFIKSNNLLDDLIRIFLESGSFEDAGFNASMIYPFAGELSQKQVITILENVLENDQIYDSFKAKPIVFAIVRINREKIPYDLWVELYKKRLDEKGISIVRKFSEFGIRSDYPALHFILSFEASWKKVDLIMKEVNFIPNFHGLITLDVLKNISDEEIQDKLS